MPTASGFRVVPTTFVDKSSIPGVKPTVFSPRLFGVVKVTGAFSVVKVVGLTVGTLPVCPRSATLPVFNDVVGGRVFLEVGGARLVVTRFSGTALVLDVGDGRVAPAVVNGPLLASSKLAAGSVLGGRGGWVDNGRVLVVGLPPGTTLLTKRGSFVDTCSLGGLFVETRSLLVVCPKPVSGLVFGSGVSFKGVPVLGPVGANGRFWVVVVPPTLLLGRSGPTFDD